MGISQVIGFCSLLICLSSISVTANTTTLQYGQTLVSPGGRFELGFFSLNSNRTFLGIWYKNLPRTVVWIANRNNPITGSSGELVCSSQGLLLSNNGTISVWSVNVSAVMNSPSLQLFDNGNLVLSDDSGKYFWQSFDEITDTLLPDMKLGWDFRIGLRRNMTSWRATDDPAAGDFTFSLDPPEAPQLVLRKGTLKQNRWGPWDGVRFSGSNELRANPVFTPLFYSSREEIYYMFRVTDNSILSRFVVTPQGLIQYLTWSESSGDWVIMVTLQRDSCDSYSVCGPYASCYTSDPNCRCLKGFSPKSPQAWAIIDWSGGCVRNWGLNCSNGDGFVKYEGLKLPDNSHLAESQKQQAASRNMTLEECRAECLMNCSCTAYTVIDIHGNGSDCLMWFSNLTDMRYFANGGDALYIRMAQAELESIAAAKRERRTKLIVAISISTISAMIILGMIVWFIMRRRKMKATNEIEVLSFREREEVAPAEDLDLPLFDLEIISAGTDKFSFANKIGQGGFGIVYKGVLPSGQEIAVKRLSQDSRQGLREFKNEVIVIAELQHRNLVKLLGCCIHREERMLVYEYLPNKSLDYHLFDKTKRKSLVWKKRFDIIMGIARGLLYLHQDSRLRIIHRDLKASNILLDGEMNPKISDFGIARIFGGEQTQERTKRVIGTYGYMSPEYALGGHFSVKSDVFSFGVIVLEIVSGKKNWGFYHPDHDLNLLGHAWNLWKEGNPLDLADREMEGSFSCNEVVRCVQIGLLCVQQRAEDRPTMSTVLFMLGNENSVVPQPKEPGFCTEISSTGFDTSSSSGKNPFTPNVMTITEVGGR